MIKESISIEELKTYIETLEIGENEKEVIRKLSKTIEVNMQNMRTEKEKFAERCVFYERKEAQKMKNASRASFTVHKKNHIYL